MPHYRVTAELTITKKYTLCYENIVEDGIPTADVLGGYIPEYEDFFDEETNITITDIEELEE